MSSRKYNTDAILGWNAPHITFPNGLPKVTEVVENDEDFTAYEQYMISIGQRNLVIWNRRQATR